VVGLIVGERISIYVFPWVCGLAMADLSEQRVCINFCLKLGKIYDWHKRFKNCRTSTDRLASHPENVAEVRNPIPQDRRLTSKTSVTP
jgi:hypothetical protein